MMMSDNDSDDNDYDSDDNDSDDSYDNTSVINDKSYLSVHMTLHVNRF